MGTSSSKTFYPSKYNISAVENEFALLNRQGINVEPGKNSYNISKPKPAGVKGVVYLDTNADKKYTTGEEAPDAHLKLTYTRLDKTQKPVADITTDSTGAYTFTSLMPGEYTLNATKLNSSTGNLDYVTEQTVTLTANKTSWVNISLALAPVSASGFTTYLGENIKDITVTFTPDKTVKNNTAKQGSATSDAIGRYSVKLTPGAYNVSVKKTEGGTIVYTYSEKLSVVLGQGTISYNVYLIKESITVNGTATYNAVGKANMTILFQRDLRIANNTATSKSVMTDKDGRYTIELTPGAYNVSIDQMVNESGINVTYSATTQITLIAGDAPQVLNMVLTRVEEL